MVKKFIWALLLLTASLVSHSLSAQEPPQIDGTWVMVPDLSDNPEQRHIRRYGTRTDGYLISFVHYVNTGGRPFFMQSTSKADGIDYPEYDIVTLAELQVSGTPSPYTHAEVPVDERTVSFTDKYEGEITAYGTRQLSADGQTLTIEGFRVRDDGSESPYRQVFRRL